MIGLKKIEWVILSGLLLLSFIPSAGGIARLLELATEPGLLPENPRIQLAPRPVVFHILGSVLYCVLGAFQFLPSIRRVYPYWHRQSGRALIGAGIICAVSGLWMTHYYPFTNAVQGELLYVVRIVVGFAMVAFILLGLTAIVRKRFHHHQAWMIRAYALAQGAGMQVLITVPLAVTVGQPSGFSRELLMTLAWVINIITAELVIKNQNAIKDGKSSTRHPDDVVLIRKDA